MPKHLKRVLRNKKALTALQTAILTGVGIAVALIVGYWVWTVVVGSIRTERLTLTIPSATFEENLFGTQGGWNITLTVKNVGPSDATIVDVRVNGKSYSVWGSSVVTVKVYKNGSWENISSTEPIKAGETLAIQVQLKKKDTGTGFVAGQTVEISIVTASNQVYTSSISLP